MAGVGVVDRDMQREVVGVNAQFVQLIGRDQQVQRQLFVAQIEANEFRQEIAGVPAQG